VSILYRPTSSYPKVCLQSLTFLKPEVVDRKDEEDVNGGESHSDAVCISLVLYIVPQIEGLI